MIAKILRSIFKKGGSEILPQAKELEHNFSAFVFQNERRNVEDLEVWVDLAGDSAIQDIKLVSGHTIIGWIQQAKYSASENKVTVGHFAIDTSLVGNGYGEAMLKGFSYAIRKQFPKASSIEFDELKRRITQQEKNYYISLFNKLKMISSDGVIYIMKL